VDALTKQSFLLCLLSILTHFRIDFVSRVQTKKTDNGTHKKYVFEENLLQCIKTCPTDLIVLRVRVKVCNEQRPSKT